MSILYFKYACLHDFDFSKILLLKIKDLARKKDQNMPFTVEPRLAGAAEKEILIPKEIFSTEPLRGANRSHAEHQEGLRPEQYLEPWENIRLK
jgi:hypothetical protein